MIKTDGVVVGCAQNQEWLLPWWYMHFRLHNEYPIAFVDFGNMSEKAKAWCKKRGQLFSLNFPTRQFAVDLKRYPQQTIKLWENAVSGIDIWEARLEFFKKPFACLQSPFDRSIWIDLDCQVRRSIDPIFDTCENAFSLALAQEPEIIRKNHSESNLIQKDEMEYNTGVIAFKRGSKILDEWATYCMESHADFRGDQEALSRLTHDRKIALPSIDPKFNWRGGLHIAEHQLINKDPNQEIVIIHWLGDYKKIIRSQMVEFFKFGMDLTLR